MARSRTGEDVIRAAVDNAPTPAGRDCSPANTSSGKSITPSRTLGEDADILEVQPVPVAGP